ncbi:MAG: hypothetical protein ACK5P5_14855 [Pseudobdellovibrionaceae bacterium]
MDNNRNQQWHLYFSIFALCFGASEQGFSLTQPFTPNSNYIAQTTTNNSAAAGTSQPTNTVMANVAPESTPVETKKVISANANRLIYFTHKDQDEVQELRVLIQPLTQPLMAGCSKCDYSVVSVNYKGTKIDLKDLQKKMDQIPENTKIVVFDFNLKDSEETQFWARQLEGLQQKGILVVSATGRADDSEVPMFLNKTVLGRNQKVILIGELSGQERMWPLSHFGPEVLTALRLPEKYSGQDLAGFYVAVRILPRVQQKSMEDWVTQLFDKKFKTKKLWLDIDEL